MMIFEQFGIDIGYVLLGNIAAIIILLIMMIIMLVKHNKLKKKYNDFMEGQDGKTLEKIILTRFHEVDEIKEHMFTVDEHLNNIDKSLLETYNKMSIVKYDAFREMGGKMSFILVFLTESNDGFILNTMHSSREGCYTYIKNIAKGQCDVPLSEEETQALEEAVRK